MRTMFYDLPLTILLLVSASLPASAFLDDPHGAIHPRIQLDPTLYQSLSPRTTNSTTNGTVTSSNGTEFVWILQDTYDYTNFFDTFNFYTGDDPTHGTVNYVNASVANQNNLTYISNRNTIIMKVDDNTTLAQGENRMSVRVSSNAIYNTGLFILDANHAPWGCAVWPAFWTLGTTGTWPQSGEIDVIEGVHDNEHNQVTWHTRANCSITPTAIPFTGTIGQVNGTNYTNCEAGGADNLPGCGVIEWSRASYGPQFDAQGGGVFAMKWDEDGIAVWSFYRVAVPQDIFAGTPDPSGWGEPIAALSPSGCDIGSYFYNHTIIFDITLCGDWAGNSYATSGCPGTCPDRLMDPANFVNASWDINNLKVYRRQNIPTVISASSAPVTKSLNAALHIGLLLATLTVFVGAL